MHWRARTGLIARLLRMRWSLSRQFWTAASGAEIAPGAEIGPGLVLPHPNGVVIHRDAVIGANCMIMQQVTIGQLAVGGVPRLGDGVYVGAGARLLGPVTIGNGAAIGANAVVLCDVPPHATAVGVPARVIHKNTAPHLASHG